MSKADKTGGDGVEVLGRSPSHLLHRALQLALDLYAEEAGPGAPTQRQYAVLSAVSAREGLTQTDLVRTTGIDRSTLADLVARMIGKGLLVREKSAADGRANAVRLSDLGREAMEAAAPKVAAADARLLARLSKGKRDTFVAALRDLSKSGEKALVKAARDEAGAEDASAAPSKPKKTKGGKDKKKKSGKAKKAAAADAAVES